MTVKSAEHLAACVEVVITTLDKHRLNIDGHCYCGRFDDPAEDAFKSHLAANIVVDLVRVEAL